MGCFFLQRAGSKKIAKSNFMTGKSSLRTNWLLDFCYGANRKIKWDFTIAELKDFQLLKAELAGPELLLRPTVTGMNFSFITKHNVHAGIDYRGYGTSG